MKIYRRILLAALLIFSLSPAVTAQETEYFLSFKVGSGTATAIEGDTQDAVLSKEKAMELISFFFSGENQTNLGSSTGGAGGAGKVVFERFGCIAPAGSPAAAALLKNLALGGHFDEAFLTARRNGFTIFKISFLLVIISEVEIEGTRGDQPVMNFILDWGAMKFETFKMNPDGTTEASTDATWSRVLNSSDFLVE